MAKQKRKSKNPTEINNEIPAGYEVCEVSGDFAPWHDFEKNSVLTGKVLHVRKATLGKGKDRKETRILTVQTAEGQRATSEAFKLTPLFDQAEKKKGKEVYIKFLGHVKLKGGRKMRDYVAAIK